MGSWLAANWSGVISVVAMILAVGVAIAHLAHAEALAQKLQSIEDSLNSFLKKS